MTAEGSRPINERNSYSPQFIQFLKAIKKGVNGMDGLLSAISIPAIAALVYWIVNLIKYTTKYNENVLTYIPLIACVLGAVCGVIAFFVAPELMIAKNVIVAGVMGGASGLTAVGFNQIIKQIEKNGGTKK